MSMFYKPVLSVDQIVYVWEYGVLDYPAVHINDILRFFEQEKVDLQIGMYFDPKVVDPFITVSYSHKGAMSGGKWHGADGHEFVDVLYQVLMKYLEETHTRLEPDE